MEFAVMNLFPNPKGKTEKEVLNEALEVFTYAEELGFDSVWLAEHHFSEYGRLDLGIGRGYQPREFNGFKINPSESRDRFNETVEILKQAWTQDEVNFEGKYFQYEGISVHPKPIQQSHISLHFAAVSNDTFRMMGEAGRPIITSPNFTPMDIIKRNFDIYKNDLTENGYNSGNYKFLFAQKIHVVKSSEEAKMTAVKISKEYYNLLVSFLPGSTGEEIVDEYKFFKKVQKATQSISLKEIERNGGNFGYPQEVIERIKFLEEVGVNQYICLGQIGHKETMQTMELFAKEVIPAFQKSSVK